MIKHHKKSWSANYAIDMTPMLDVTFILLIFFILTANVAQHIYSVNLPEADPSFKKPAIETLELKITIFANGTYAVGSKKYQKIEDVKRAILRKPLNKTKIVLIPDASSKTGALISLLTFFEGNNITNVDILTEERNA